MIVDKLSCATQYFNLDEKLKKGFEFLLNSNLEQLPEGRYPIQGEEIFANVQKLTTKPKEEKKWEKHRKYIDIQYLIKGVECFGVGFSSDFKEILLPYSEKNDIEFLRDSKHNYINLQEGEFAVFYPNDIHAPMLSVEEDIEIKKVIVKVRI